MLPLVEPSFRLTNPNANDASGATTLLSLFHDELGAALCPLYAVDFENEAEATARLVERGVRAPRARLIAHTRRRKRCAICAR